MSAWQLSKRVLHRLKVGISIVLTLGFLYVLPGVLIAIPGVQRFIAQRASEELSKLFQTPVSLYSVELDGWRNISLHRVTILDSLGRKALYSDELRAGIELEALFRENRVHITSARLFNLSLLLDIDSVSGKTNVQHIIDALSSDSSEPSTLTVDLHNILLRDASIRILENARPKQYIDSLDLQASHLLITPDSLAATLNELTFKTEQGLKLRDMSARLELKGKKLSIEEGRIYLPNSSIYASRLLVDLEAKGLNIVEQLQLDSLNLYLPDLSGLHAVFGRIRHRELSLRSQVSRVSGGLQLREVELSVDNDVYARFSAILNTDSLGSLMSSSLDAHKVLVDADIVDRLPALFADNAGAEALPSFLPKLKPLGQIAYSGQVQYQKADMLSIEGLISTELGKWTLYARAGLQDARMESLEARLGTSGFNIKPILGEQLDYIKGGLEAKLSFPKSSLYPVGSALFDVKELVVGRHTFSNLLLNIQGREKKGYDLTLSSQDARLPLNITSNFLLSTTTPTDIVAKVVGHKMHLSPFVKGLDNVSIEGDIALKDIDLSNLQGRLSLPLLHFNVNGKPLDLSHLELLLRKDNDVKALSLKLPWLSLDVKGRYEWGTLAQDFLTTLTAEVPVLQTLFADDAKSRKSDTSVIFNAEIDSIPQSVSSILGVPIKVKRGAMLSAALDSREQLLDLSLSATEWEVAEHRVNNFSLDLNKHHINISGDAHLSGGIEFLGAVVRGRAIGNELQISTNLGKDASGVENGDFNFTTLLLAPQTKALQALKDLNALVTIDHSRVRIHTALWDIAPARITYAGDLVRVDGLSLSTEGRRLAVAGGLGAWATDRGLQIQLENINLGYILKAAGVDFDLIDTDLTGVVDANLEGKHLRASARVKSPHFYVNKEDIGAVDLGLGFSTEDLLIRLNGQINQLAGGHSLVDGWIKPVDGSGLNIDFDARQIDLSFVGSFMRSFLSKLGGRGTGKLRLHGLFAKGVTVAGDVEMSEGIVGVSALGTEYRFDHRLHIEDDRINLEGITLRDDEGNTGVLHGYVGHKFFSDFDIQLRADEMKAIKVLQTSSPKIMPTYGKAYASGSAVMSGNDTRLKIDVDVRGEEGTDLMLDFNQLSAGKDEGLMNFTHLRPSTAYALEESSSELTPPSLSTAIDINLKLNVTPQAKIGLRMGDDNTSLLSGRGEGILHISAPSNAKPEVYGTVSVHEGEYLFSVQQLARKRFVLRQGGSMAFRGDPMKANLQNIQAVYALTANIADLDETISQVANQTNIPVHCLLNISGEVMKPQIKFGLELPRVDAEIERRVRALLNTEDAITRQMLYLIALGKFYTNDADKRTSTTTNDWTAVASSAISEQISSLLGNLSEHFKLGTSIKTKSTAFDDTDIEVNFSGSLLDNRLTFNGNIGYHDNPYLNNEYLGEFDFEYRLNKSGSLRLKGYNRYNTMYQYLKQSLLTQGFGVLYRQRFDKFSELFRPKAKVRFEPADTIPQ